MVSFGIQFSRGSHSASGCMHQCVPAKALGDCVQVSQPLLNGTLWAEANITSTSVVAHMHCLPWYFMLLLVP